MASKVRQSWDKFRAFAKTGTAWLGTATLVTGGLGYLYWRGRDASTGERFEDLPFLGPQKQIRPTLVLGTSNVILGNAWHAPASRLFTFRRPGLDTLFDRLKDKYEIVLYSTSDYMHSQELRARLDPKGVAIQDFVSRDVEELRSEETQAKELEQRRARYGSLIDHIDPASPFAEDRTDIKKRIARPQKHLRDLGRPLHSVVLVDVVENLDFPYNTIVIPPWDGSDPEDRELFNIIPMLEGLVAEKTDVRPRIRETKVAAKSERKATGIVWLEQHAKTQKRASALTDLSSHFGGQAPQHAEGGSKHWLKKIIPGL